MTSPRKPETAGGGGWEDRPGLPPSAHSPLTAAEVAVLRAGDAAHLTARAWESSDGESLGWLRPDPPGADEEHDPRFRDKWLGGPRA
jgi:hypothetical protein